MTEPENFEDDLFDDLYNDDAPARAAARSAPEPVAAPVAEPAGNNSNNNDDNDYHDTSYPAPEQQDPGDDSHMNGANDEYEEDDDDVDFNLGNGDSHAPDTPSYNNAPAQQPMHRGPNAKEDGKMFIGGLNWETTDDSLRDYFSQFGEVTECTVMRDGATGRSRGFGFLTFKDPKTVNVVMVKEHYLDGKIIDPKRAIPRDEQEKTSKIFVGGVSQETTDAEFREYFAQFGRVVDATLMMDKDTGRPRGFGFVTFESEAGVEACLATDLEIHGKPIEVKKAQPRGNMREEEEANRRGGGKFGKGRGAGNNMDEGSSQGGGMGGGGPGGITPQAMAQQWSRMQQMFQMWQQQMAMNRGMAGGPMGMNPQAQMMQVMQMQQMQQQMMLQAQQGGAGGRGAGGPMGNMNPQMMQQMMNQMGAQMGGSPQGPGSPGAQGAMQQQIPGGPAAAAGGNQARPAYNAYEQQAFEQQKYDQRGGRGGQAYGMGGGGGPTSWEGMYDDVPQPNVPNQMGGNMAGGMRGGGGFHRGRGAGGFHQNQQQQQQPQQQSGPVDPSKAPPANAPTGPKNAGRPGANYRGGGRGGASRGFHPYGR